MAIVLNHTIVPAREGKAAARFFADIFGLKYEVPAGHFEPVRVNETLTFDFQTADSFEIHHYAFHVSNAEFNEILERVKKARIPYGSEPWNLENGKLNSLNGGKGVYFRDPNGHILELITRA